MRCKQKKRFGNLNPKGYGIVPFLILIFSLSPGKAQETVVTAGGNASGNEGLITYSIGQVFFQTQNSTSVIITEGMQQPFGISVISRVEGAQGITLTASVYPNPAVDYITLNIGEFDLSNLIYQLYDINGKLLKIEKITNDQTKIMINHLPPANYFVKIIQGNLEVKTFKIFKK